MVAESAGAYLATYVAAMKKSEALQKAIGYKPTNMIFKAMALISGMFYTARKDKFGFFLSRSFYGNDARSKADILERYTLDFTEELGNKGIEHYLKHMGSDSKLLHAFPVLNSGLSESERVIDEIVSRFKKHEPLK